MKQNTWLEWELQKKSKGGESMKEIEFTNDMYTLLQLNLMEKEYPFFEKEDLELLFKTNGGSIPKTCWKACLLKANTDDMVKVGPIELKSSGKDYWLKLADMYRQEYEDELRKNGASTSGRYKNHMTRYDGQ